MPPKTIASFGYVPTCLASRLTVSSNLAASFAVPHVKYTSSSPDVGAVNFLEVAAPDPPDLVAFRSRIFRAFVFPIVARQTLFKR